MIKKIEYYNLNIKLNNQLKLNDNIQLQNLFDAAHNLEKEKRAPIFFGDYEHEDYTNAKKNKKKLGVGFIKLKVKSKMVRLNSTNLDKNIMT